MKDFMISETDAFQRPNLEETHREMVEKQGTELDVQDMVRMGKAQLFRRNFDFYSILGFSMILMSSWETQLATATFGLTNGGTAGAIYIYIFVFFGFGLAVISMAEMASMYAIARRVLERRLLIKYSKRAPTAGGQYHWVSEFASPRAQKFVSYMTGWLCVLGWQAGSAAGCYLAGTEIQGLIVLNNSDYVPQRWQGTLLAIALVFFSLFVNTTLARNLPSIEGIVLILHVSGFIAILVPLWVLGPRSSPHAVFTEFNDGGHWHSMGLSALIGILSPTVSLIGPDAAVHMSEEVRNASKTIPRIMLATAVFNGALGFVMLITICFTLGNLGDVLQTATGYPFIQVFYNATLSRGGATTMTSIMIILSQFCAVTNMATASRQLFSFARDQGVPFHGFFEKVRPGLNIPLNAVFATTIFSILLISISFGSTIAFNQLTALGTVALLSSYMLSIGSMAWLRIRGRPLLRCYFSLGRWGLLINILALMFLILAFTMIFFPPTRDPSLESMNWSIVIFAGVLICSVSYFWFRARYKYVGPVKLVKKDE